MRGLGWAGNDKQQFVRERAKPSISRRQAAFSGRGTSNVSGIDKKTSEGLWSISNYETGACEFRSAVLERG